MEEEEREGNVQLSFGYLAVFEGGRVVLHGFFCLAVEPEAGSDLGGHL